MAFLTPDEFRKLNTTASATEITPEAVTDCLETAIDELIILCGEAVVTEVKNASGEPDLKVRRFRKAQDKLAFRELLHKMSSRFRSGGIQVTEKDTNAEATNTYEKFSDTEKRRAALYDEAVRLVTSYLIVEESAEEDRDESTFVPIQFGF